MTLRCAGASESLEDERGEDNAEEGAVLAAEPVRR